MSVKKKPDGSYFNSSNILTDFFDSHARKLHGSSRSWNKIPYYCAMSYFGMLTRICYYQIYFIFIT